MTPPTPDTPADSPGWHPDPLNRYEHRYFNGTTWTADVANDGQRAIDPIGATAVPDRRRSATVGIVLGALAVVGGWIPVVGFAGLVMSAAALWLGLRARRSERQRGTAATVLGGVGLAVSALGVAMTFLVLPPVLEFVNASPHRLDVESCAVDDGLATVTGSISNLGDAPAGFVIYTTLGGSFDSVEVDTLAPDATAAWRATIPRVDTVESCDPSVAVYGPFPLGIEISPP